MRYVFYEFKEENLKYASSLVRGRIFIFTLE